MVRNIPAVYSQQKLLEELASLGFVPLGQSGREFDFFDLPFDKGKRCNMGHCFINFVDTDAVHAFRAAVEQLCKGTRRRALQVVPAALQGYEANVAHYETSTVLGHSALFLQDLQPRCRVTKEHGLLPPSTTLGASTPGTRPGAKRPGSPVVPDTKRPAGDRAGPMDAKFAQRVAELQRRVDEAQGVVGTLQDVRAALLEFCTEYCTAAVIELGPRPRAGLKSWTDDQIADVVFLRMGVLAHTARAVIGKTRVGDARALYEDHVEASTGRDPHPPFHRVVVRRLFRALEEAKTALNDATRQKVLNLERLHLQIAGRLENTCDKSAFEALDLKVKLLDEDGVALMDSGNENFARVHENFKNYPTWTQLEELGILPQSQSAWWREGESGAAAANGQDGG